MSRLNDNPRQPELRTGTRPEWWKAHDTENFMLALDPRDHEHRRWLECHASEYYRDKSVEVWRVELARWPEAERNTPHVTEQLFTRRLEPVTPLATARSIG